MILRRAVRLEELSEDDPCQPDSLSKAARERIKKAVGEILP